MLYLSSLQYRSNWEKGRKVVDWFNRGNGGVKRGRVGLDGDELSQRRLRGKVFLSKADSVASRRMLPIKGIATFVDLLERRTKLIR